MDARPHPLPSSFVPTPCVRQTRPASQPEEEVGLSCLLFRTERRPSSPPLIRTALSKVKHRNRPPSRSSRSPDSTRNEVEGEEEGELVHAREETMKGVGGKEREEANQPAHPSARRANMNRNSAKSVSLNSDDHKDNDDLRQEETNERRDCDEPDCARVSSAKGNWNGIVNVNGFPFISPTHSQLDSTSTRKSLRESKSGCVTEPSGHRLTDKSPSETHANQKTSALPPTPLVRRAPAKAATPRNLHQDAHSVKFDPNVSSSSDKNEQLGGIRLTMGVDEVSHSKQRQRPPDLIDADRKSIQTSMSHDCSPENGTKEVIRTVKSISTCESNGSSGSSQASGRLVGFGRKLISQVSPIPVERTNSAAPFSSRLKGANEEGKSGRGIRIVDVQLKEPSPVLIVSRPMNQIAMKESNARTRSSAAAAHYSHLGSSAHRMHSKSMENLISLYEHLTSSGPPQPPAPIATLTNSAPAAKAHTVLPKSESSSSSMAIKLPSFKSSDITKNELNRLKTDCYNQDRVLEDLKSNSSIIGQQETSTIPTETASSPLFRIERSKSALESWSQFLPILPVIGSIRAEEQSHEEEKEVEGETGDLPYEKDIVLVPVETCKSHWETQLCSLSDSLAHSLPSHITDDLPVLADEVSSVSPDEKPCTAAAQILQKGVSTSLVDYESIFKSKYESLRERYARERRLWMERTTRERTHGAQVDDILRQLQDTLLKSKQQLSDMKDKIEASPKGVARIVPPKSASPTIDAACWQEILRLCCDMRHIISAGESADDGVSASPTVDVSQLSQPISVLQLLCEQKINELTNGKAEPLMTPQQQSVSLKAAMNKQELAVMDIRQRISRAQTENRRLASEMKERIAGVNSVEDARDLSSIQLRLDASQRETRLLNEKLREAHANYDYLELAHQRLQQEMVSLQERHAADESIMRQRIDDLTSKLYSSERSLVAAKTRLTKCELMKKCSSRSRDLTPSSGEGTDGSGKGDTNGRRSRVSHSLDRNQLNRSRLSKSTSTIIVDKSLKTMNLKMRELEKKVDHLHMLLTVCLPHHVPMMVIDGEEGQHITPDGSVTSDLGSSSSVATSESLGATMDIGATGSEEEAATVMTTSASTSTRSGFSSPVSESPEREAPLHVSRNRRNQNGLISAEDQLPRSLMPARRLWMCVQDLEDRFQTIERTALGVIHGNDNKTQPMKPIC